MRNKTVTKEFYLNKLGFQQWGGDYPDYLMLVKELKPKENYGQVYIRVSEIEQEFNLAQKNGVAYKALESKPWGQKEFSVLDPDNNLLTFGEGV
jgi:hypothetical protein